jgi:hypothetical protein
MFKRRSPDHRASLDPDDVLADRVKVSAGELLDLIHHVNATGREPGAREVEQRYAQKSCLQSLLVRRFGPELEVVLDPERGGTVSLLHPGHGRDGCHAVISALDEDARAWVQLQIRGPSAVRASGRPRDRSLRGRRDGPAVDGGYPGFAAPPRRRGDPLVRLRHCPCRGATSRSSNLPSPVSAGCRQLLGIELRRAGLRLQAERDRVEALIDLAKGDRRFLGDDGRGVRGDPTFALSRGDRGRAGRIVVT